jgi:aminoglycoside phosphotransferase (APT) family kinase protein
MARPAGTTQYGRWAASCTPLDLTGRALTTAPARSVGQDAACGYQSGVAVIEIGAQLMGLGKELGRLAHDRLDRRSGLPGTLDELSARQVGELLGKPVRRVERLAETTGTTARARLAVEGSGTPPSVFIKLAPRPAAVRLFVGLARLGPTEVSFYQRLAPALPIAAPRAHATRYDGRTGRFALVLEDLDARGVRFADVRSAPSLGDAEAVVRALATLHGTYAAPTGSGALSWVVTNVADPAATVTARLLRLVVGRLRRTDPDLLPHDSMLLIERQRQFEARLPRDEFTLLHGDPHFGNVYFDESVPGFVDWQVLRRGLGLRDLAYFVTLSLPTERRRAEEGHLLDVYLDELPHHGGPVLDRPESWSRYRLLVAHAFVAAAFTRAAGGLQVEEIAGLGLKRAGAAMDDLGTMDEVRRLLS